MYLSTAELKQLQILKKKTPTDRFFLMLQLIAGQIEAMRAGLKYKYPKKDKKGIEKCLKENLSKIYSMKH